MSVRRALPPPRYERGFWAWAERQALSIQTDPEKRARVFKIAWFVSLAFAGLGFVFIFLMLMGKSVV